MTLHERLIGGAVDGLMLAIDTIASFWQTPREVEWAKAAADGLAEREAETEVAEPSSHFCPDCGPRDAEDVERCNYLRCRALAFSPPWLMPKTSAPTPGAVDGPAEGEPPEPSAGVDWLGRSDRDSLWRLSGVHDPAEAVKYGWHDDCWSWTDDGGETWRPSHGQRGVILPAPSGEQWIKVRSAAVEPPASVPAAECSAPEFDWVTTAIPVIAGVLAEHLAEQHHFGPVLCHDSGGRIHGEFADWWDWRVHVSPIIAAALQTPRTTTSHDFPSGDRPRPLADFPKHQ